MNKDEAIQVIRSNYPTGRKQLCEALETLIPELKESDDEKIKNEIIDYLKGFIPHHNDDLVAKSKLWIAWLESQGEQKPVISDDGLREGIAHFGITQYQIDNWLKKYVDVEKQGEQNNKHLYDVIIALWDLLDKIDTFSDLQIDDTNPDNPFKKIEYIAQERHKFVKSDGYNLYIQGEQITDFKQSKQKPVDKVEPKFKIGDWIVSNRTNKTYKIDSINTKDANYIIYSCVPSVYTNEDSPCFSESMIHLWTIQDATDGDVISFNDGHGNDCIELIKSITGKKIEFWFCLTNGNCYEVFDGIIPYTNFASRKDATPATKEQHDLLFQRMEEAGYEWDAIKKELKKIEQKPSTSVTEFDAEIERFCKECFITDANERDWVFCIARHFADWQKNRKNPAWSEEDKNMLQNILECLKNGWSKLPTDILKYESWLKSIKERYTWRPSDEQMEALYTYIYNPQYFNSPDPRMELVESVYKDLKKLKEE